MTHPARQRAAVSHCISPSSPISQRGVMIPKQPLSWQQAVFPLPLQLPSGARANRADGSREAAGISRHGAGTGPLPPLWEKEPGVSVPHLLCCGAFLYQMVKSAGTGFSFPPKLDKLESNELVRGKINPVHSFQKAPPFTDFLSENITDITCCGTQTVLEVQDWLRIKSWTHPCGSCALQEWVLPHLLSC